MSQERAARAWDEDRFGTQIIPMEVPALGEDGEISEETVMISKDEGLRETTMESLAALKPTATERPLHQKFVKMFLQCERHLFYRLASKQLKTP